MITPSASKLGLALRCLYPWTSGERWPAFVPSEAASWGTAVSAMADVLAQEMTRSPEHRQGTVERAVAKAGVDSHLARYVAAMLAELLEADIGMNPDVWMRSETALALDVRAGAARELRSNGPRDYSDVRSGELVGTPDLVFRDAAGTLVVRDYKTGEYARRLRPEDSAQLRMLGLAASLAYGAESVAVELVQVDDDRIYTRRAVLDAFELDVIATELSDMLDALERPSVPRPGLHCRDAYCPIIAQCPATKAALAAVDTAAALPHPMSVSITSPEQAASVRVRLKMVETACEQIRTALEAYVTANGPVEVEPGVMWGPVEHEGRESIDLGAAGAVRIVRERLGEHADAALEVRTSKAAIERAAKAAANGDGRGAATKLARGLLEELRGIGALRQGAPFTKFETFKREQ